jgi:thiol-disulfide isomerase/thioredoxin
MSGSHSEEAFDATAEGVLYSFLSTHSDKPVLIQLTSPKCTRCVPFSQFVQRERARRSFHWAKINVFDNRDIVEAFEVTTLPAFVIVPRGHTGELTKDSSVTYAQNSSVETLAIALDAHCPCEVKLDEDF